MRDRRRLRRLSMRMRSEYRITIRVSLGKQYVTQSNRPFIQRQDQHPLLHSIHRHIDVVARPRRVQSPCGVFAALTNQQAVDEEKQIFAAAVVFGLANLGNGDTSERVAYYPRVSTWNNPLFGQHDE